LIFIDEAHAMKPSALERLRLLTNKEGDDAHLFTIILTGQIELARRLEHPRCANLFQRIGVYCHLAKIESQDLMRDYIEHRLARAGTSRRIFTDDAYNAIWKYSENGVPRLINKIAKRALKVGQTQTLETIDADIVRQIVSHFAGVSNAIAPEHSECGRDASANGRELFNTPTMHEGPSLSSPRRPAASLSPVDEPANRPENANGIDDGAAPVVAAADQQAKQFPMAGMIKFPAHVHLKAKELPADERLKLAGQLAADMLKRHPHLIQQLGSTNDPVPAWTILRNVVMRQLDHYPAS
jgi:hypothetical protein